MSKFQSNVLHEVSLATIIRSPQIPYQAYLNSQVTVFMSMPPHLIPSSNPRELDCPSTGGMSCGGDQMDPTAHERALL